MNVNIIIHVVALYKKSCSLKCIKISDTEGKGDLIHRDRIDGGGKSGAEGES